MLYRVFSRPDHLKPEWPTLILIILCTAGWMGLTVLVAMGGAYLFALPVLIYLTTLHSSLQHEVLHGHPTSNRMLNEMMIFPALGMLFPYQRFRRLHLTHHNDARLTDPQDDPESFYLRQRDWRNMYRPIKCLLMINNTFAGRLVLGPAISVAGLIIRDVREIARGNTAILRAWFWHLPAVLAVAWWLTSVAGFPVLLYLVCVAYPAMSLLMVRTFAEHRAHEMPDARSIIITAGPVWSLLFLNNNLHAVHHQHPSAAWYRLPALFRQNRQTFMQRTQGYCYSGYGPLMCRFLFRAKEPVAHPLDRTTREIAG